MVLPALRALPGIDPHVLGLAHPRVLPLYRAANLFERLLPARGALAPWELGSEVRAWRPDRALTFTDAMSGAVLAALSGAKLRLGRRRPGRTLLLTDLLPASQRSRSLWKEYAELVTAAGGAEIERPVFRLEPEEPARARAEELLAPLGGRAPVALAPGAAYGPAKQWPMERFEAVARALRDRGEATIVTGGDAERPLGARLAEAGALDLTGRTGLMDAVAVLSICRALITNDSGALHLGRAAGVPVIALFGSSTPDWTGPEPHEGVALWRGLSCSPCFRRRCPLTGDDHLRCLREIPVDDVMTALNRVMRVRP
jgi:heptosyltransferase-2